MINAQNEKTTIMIAPADATTNTALTANLDTSGADYATLTISYSAEQNTNAVNCTLSVLESDDTVVTNFATIVADSTQDFATAHALVYHIDCKYRKRYLRISNKTGTTATNDKMTVVAIGRTGRLATTPANTSAMVGSTADVVTIV